MTALTEILICPTTPLRMLPAAERDILRRFFTAYVRGMDAPNHQRWVRFVRDLFAAEAGEGFRLQWVAGRSGPYHRRHRAILERLFDSQERFRHIDKLHDWLKVGAWKCECSRYACGSPSSTAKDGRRATHRGPRV